MSRNFKEVREIAIKKLGILLSRQRELQCNVPNTGLCLTCWRNSKETSMAEGSEQGKEYRDRFWRGNR